MINVDAANRLALAVVAREMFPPVAPEARWEWLSGCWEDLFQLARIASLSFDEVDGLLAKGDGDPNAASGQLPSLLAQLASVAVRLDQQRDTEHRKQAVRALESVVGDLRRALLSVGQAIGWHPRHIGALWSGIGDGRHRGMILHALHLRSCLTSERLLQCYRGTLREAVADDPALRPSLDAMDQALHPWQALFAEFRIPASAVSRGLLSQCGGVSLTYLRRLMKAVGHDVDCLVQGAQAWQVERNISLVPMMFAARRLSVDVEEMRQIAASSVIGGRG